MIIDVMRYSYFDGINSRRLKGIVERRTAVINARGINKRATEVLADFEPFMVQPYGENIIRAMEQAGIDVTCYAGWDNLDEGQGDGFTLARNWKDAEVARKHPDRIIAFASIDPRRKKAPELLRRCIEDFGVKGLNLYPCASGYSVISEQAYRLISLVQAYHLPLVTHTLPGPIGRNKWEHPLLLDDVARDFPELNIIASHTGSSWWCHDWCAVAQYNKNLFGELSAWQSDAVMRYERFCENLRELLDLGGGNKLMFGSGWPIVEWLLPTADWVKIIQRLPQDAPSGIPFTAGEVAGILGGNARTVLGL